VVVVEDDVDSRNALEMILQSAAQKVRIAASHGRRCGYSWRTADVVLTDLAMPEQDGYALARALKAKGEQPPIIALTRSSWPPSSARPRIGLRAPPHQADRPGGIASRRCHGRCGEADKFAAERFKRRCAVGRPRTERAACAAREDEPQGSRLCARFFG